MFNSGCRQGEARALHWSDVSYKERIITVRHNFSEQELTTPKGNAEREIPLTKNLQEILFAVPKTIRSEFVFTLNGKPYYESALGKIWRKACKNFSMSNDNAKHGLIVLLGLPALIVFLCALLIAANANPDLSLIKLIGYALVPTAIISPLIALVAMLISESKDE